MADTGDKREDYDREAVQAAFEKGLPHAMKVAGHVGDRLAADMAKRFGPTLQRRDPTVPSSNIPPEYADESMCSN